MSPSGLDLAGKIIQLTGGPLGLGLVAKAVGGVAGLVWAGSLLWMLRLQRRMKADPALATALDDELVRHTRLRAIAVAFGAMIVTQALLLLTGGFFSLPASIGAQFTILVGLVSFLGTFLRTRELQSDA